MVVVEKDVSWLELFRVFHDIGVATFIRHLTVLTDRLSGFNGLTIRLSTVTGKEMMRVP